MNDLQIFALQSPQGLNAAQGGRRYLRNGAVQFNSPQLGWVNSALRKDEWEQLDQKTVAAAVKRLNGIELLVKRGQTFRLGGIGSVMAEYNQISEMTAAKVNISGSSTGDAADSVDYKLVGVPVPVIYKPYQYDIRTLEAGRRFGNAFVADYAQASAQVVAEQLEQMLFNGYSSLALNGQTIYGFTTHPSRNTGSATGDWGTAGNAVTTISNMIDAATGDQYYGPYIIFVSTTQFNQANNVFFTDGSGDNQMKRIMQLTNVEAVFYSDWLADGVVVLVSMDSNVVDLAYVPGYGFGIPEGDTPYPVTGITNIEWMSGDGMVNYFKSLTIAVPRVKSEYSGKCGVVHYTGA